MNIIQPPWPIYGAAQLITASPTSTGNFDVAISTVGQANQAIILPGHVNTGGYTSSWGASTNGYWMLANPTTARFVCTNWATGSTSIVGTVYQLNPNYKATLLAQALTISTSAGNTDTTVAAHDYPHSFCVECLTQYSDPYHGWWFHPRPFNATTVRWYHAATAARSITAYCWLISPR